MEESDTAGSDPATRILRRLQSIADQRPGETLQIELVRNVNGDVIDVIDATSAGGGRQVSLDELQRRARFEALDSILDPEAIRARTAAADERRTGVQTGVCFFDLDLFTQFNETRGRVSGDEVLQATTDRLRDAVRDGDYVMHIRDDEIVVVLTGLHGIDDAVAVAEILRATVAKPIELDDETVDVTLSVGVTLVGDGETTVSVLERADVAMRQAKQAGGDQVFVIGS